MHRVIPAVLIGLGLLVSTASTASAAPYTQTNLVSDIPGLATLTEPTLVNPWGISFSPTGPFWFSDNGSGVSDLLDGRGRPLPLVVKCRAMQDGHYVPGSHWYFRTELARRAPEPATWERWPERGLVAP